MAPSGAESPPRLALITQMLDEQDPIMGYMVPVVRELARRTERLDVVANEVHVPVPDLGPGVTVTSLGKEDSASRFERGARLQRALIKLVRGRRPDAVLAHMCPVYANLAAPVLKSSRVPIMLWYVYPDSSRELRVATRLSSRVLTSLPGSFPFATAKLRIIGHSIDVDSIPFRPQPRAQRPLRLAGLGRTSKEKGFETAILATGRLRGQGVDARLRIIGPSSTPDQRRHRDTLVTLSRDHGLEDEVSFEGSVDHDEIPEILQRTDVLLNTTRAGSGDKVVFEAMAAGTPVVVSNPAFAHLVADLPMRLAFDEDDDRMLAERIAQVASTDELARASTLRELRSRVERSHSLAHWGDEVVRSARELGGARADLRAG